jgi:hypothetical protein
MRKGENYMSEVRLDLSCLIEDIPVTIVTTLGTVYQGTVLEWGCGQRSSANADGSTDNANAASMPRAYEGYGGFIRLELTCDVGEICCNANPTANPAIVNGIRSSVDTTYSLFQKTNIVLINWADISAIGPQRNCLTLTTT